MNRSILIVILVVAAAAGALYFSGVLSDAGGRSQADRADLFEVKRGELRIEVTEDGELEAATSVKVRSEIEGRNTIEWLIPEGSMVKQGDKLAVLDISGFSDREETQAISLSRSKSGLVSAETGYQIQKSQNLSDIDKAKTKLYFAQLDFEKFTGQRVLENEQTVETILHQWAAQAERELRELEKSAATESGIEASVQENAVVQGQEQEDAEETPKPSKLAQEPDRVMSEGQQRLDQSLSDISLKQEALSQAEEKLAWTRRLYEKKYVPEQDLKRDEFAVDKARYDLEVAKSKMRLLVTYDLRKEIRDLESKVQEATDELERTKLRCKAQLESKKSDWDAKKQQHDIEVAKLEKLRENIKGGVITSPSPGLVVYAKSGNWRRQEPIDVGSDVQRGQTILILPDTSMMVAKLNIPEAQREKIRPNLTATLTVDSLPDRTFTGHVTYIGQTADTQSSWLNPDIKQYRCTVQIHGDTAELRPNQSTNVTIEVATLENVLSVPIQAVQRAQNVHFVWVHSSRGPVARMVKIGQASANAIEITQGLEEGDLVYLHDLETADRPEFAEENAEIERQRAEEEANRKAEAAKKRKEAAAKALAKRSGNPKPIDANGEKQQEGSGRRGGMQEMEALFQSIAAAFPEYKDKISDRRARFGLFRDDAFKKKVEGHAEIGPKWKAMMERFRGARNRNRGEGGERGNRGERGSRGERGEGGSRRRSGGSRERDGE